MVGPRFAKHFLHSDRQRGRVIFGDNESLFRLVGTVYARAVQLSRRCSMA